jgi:hypothetical protein
MASNFWIGHSPRAAARSRQVPGAMRPARCVSPKTTLQAFRAATALFRLKRSGPGWLPNRLGTGARKARADAVIVRPTPEAWFSARRPRRRGPDATSSPRGQRERTLPRMSTARAEGRHVHRKARNGGVVFACPEAVEGQVGAEHFLHVVRIFREAGRGAAISTHAACWPAAVSFGQVDRSVY